MCLLQLHHYSGEYYSPHEIAVGPDNNVYVADTFNGRIQVHTSEGVFVRTWEVGGWPKTVAVDQAGTAFVADGLGVSGKVVSLTDYGAFVELEPGVEGLVHVSEMSWTHEVRHPSRVVAIGDSIDAQVLHVDQQGRKISLGMKQTAPNPWDIIQSRYPIGTRIEGKVKSVTDFGAFVGLDEGIDGLVMNPAGFTYRGEALRDCILACGDLPYIEVHISNLAKRDIKSALVTAANGMIMGFGLHGYVLALDGMLDLLKTR